MRVGYTVRGFECLVRELNIGFLGFLYFLGVTGNRVRGFAELIDDLFENRNERDGGERNERGARTCAGGNAVTTNGFSSGATGSGVGAWGIDSSDEM